MIPSRSVSQLGGWVWAPITVANGVGYVAVDTNVAASGPLCAGISLARVAPGDPSNSLLYDELIKSMPACGAPMPPTGPLSEESIERIRTWIMNGAPDD
jgi:hypothetical protein